jgi:hypothetical protein
MMFRALTTGQDCLAAWKKLKEALEKSATKIYRDHAVGSQASTEYCDVHWNDKQRFWCFLSKPDPNDGRYWCPFGIDDPAHAKTLSITVEINPPLQGINRKVAGAFVLDSEGHIYLAHSGRIGGGKKGIGKSTFVTSYRHGNWQHVSWPDGSRKPMVILGRLDTPDLPTQIGNFVRAVARFKTA